MENNTSACDEDDLPALGQNATEGQLGEALVEAAVLGLQQLYESRSGLDFGVDGVIEFTTDGKIKRATGRQVGVQVKRGLSIVKKTRYGFTLYCTEAHANYWLGHSLPIIVVHSDPATSRLRWQHVNSSTLRRTPHGYAIDLPPESELCASLDSLRALADDRVPAAAAEIRTLILPYNTRLGIQTDESELGLAALEFSRAARRGTRCRVIVVVDEEPDLVASIDAIRDISNPTADERLDAIIREDILHDMRKKATKLQRALTQLLTHRTFVDIFGYRNELIAEAIRRLASPQVQRERATIALDAWPTYSMEEILIRFEVPAESMNEFFAENSFNSVAIRMGSAGGCVVGDLHPDIVATRFVPVLAQRIIDIADDRNLPDDEALSSIDVPPFAWLMGLA